MMSTLNTGKKEQQFIIEWYQLYKNRTPTFKYSFEFLTGLLQEIESRDKYHETSWMVNKSHEWIDRLRQLTKLKGDITNVIQDKLQMIVNERSCTDLLEVKRQISNWLQNDIEHVNQRTIIRQGSSVTIFDQYGNIMPFLLQGKEREDTYYRIHMNREYLSLICQYFIKFTELDELIHKLTEFTELKPSTHDKWLLVNQCDWEP